MGLARQYSGTGKLRRTLRNTLKRTSPASARVRIAGSRGNDHMARRHKPGGHRERTYPAGSARGQRNDRRARRGRCASWIETDHSELQVKEARNQASGLYLVSETTNRLQPSSPSQTDLTISSADKL